MDHALAFAACLVLALFGISMLVAFGAAFSHLNVLARSIELARQRKKRFVWWYVVGGFAADAQIWRETKGIRWLVSSERHSAPHHGSSTAFISPRPNQAMQLTASKLGVHAWSICHRERILRCMHRGLAAADLVSR